MSLLDKLVIKEYATYMAKLDILHISVLIRKYRLEQFFVLWLVKKDKYKQMKWES